MAFPVLFYIRVYYTILIGFKYSYTFLTGYSILLYYIIILETLSYAGENESLSTLQNIT